MKETPKYALDLRTTVQQAAEKLLQVDDERASQAPAPGKWSAKEIIGHLIDSACNNHRRFVIAPAKSDLVFEGYQQEYWVETQHYKQANWQSLIELWRAYNLHISYVMQMIPAGVREREHRQHSLKSMAWNTIAESEPATLDYLMEDYVEHLKHHLGQIEGIVGYSLVGG